MTASSVLKFMKEKGLRQELYALSGKGMNRFGDFILVGKAIKRNSFDGTCEYTIQMTKKYEWRWRGVESEGGEKREE